jgi:uncharacterized membrane protein
MAPASIAKLVHILGMFGAYALTLVPLLVLVYLARREQVAALGPLLRARKALGGVAGPLMLVGLAGGVATMLLGGWSATAPWIVASLFLFIAGGAWESALARPWERRLVAVLAGGGAAGADKEAGRELRAVLRSPRPLVGGWGALASVAAIESLMVLKPSFGL